MNQNRLRLVTRIWWGINWGAIFLTILFSILGIIYGSLILGMLAALIYIIMAYITYRISAEVYQPLIPEQLIPIASTD